MQTIADKLNYQGKRFEPQTEDDFWGCDTASNPTIMFLLVPMIVCIICRVCRTNHMQNTFVLCSVLSLLVQCGMMGYSSFRTRYLVGVMALICICIGVTIDKLRISESWKKNIALSIITLSSLGAVNVLSYQVGDVYASVSGETLHQYFLDYDLHESGYYKLLEHINNNHFTKIGIATEFGFEYVLWAEIDELERLEAVNLGDSPYHMYEDLNYDPDCIIMELRPEDEYENHLMCHGKEYTCTWTNTGNYMHYAVYTRE